MINIISEHFGGASEHLHCISTALGLAVCDGVVNQRAVLRQLGCSEDEGGIGGCICGLELLDAVEIACVGDHCGERFELLELIGHWEESRECRCEDRCFLQRVHDLGCWGEMVGTTSRPQCRQRLLWQEVAIGI